MIDEVTSRHLGAIQVLGHVFGAAVGALPLSSLDGSRSSLDSHTFESVRVGGVGGGGNPGKVSDKPFAAGAAGL